MLSASPEAGEAPAEPPFDDTLYLKAFPDVAEAVEHGAVASAEDHYLGYGQHEGRLAMRPYREALAALAERRKAAAAPACSIDVAVACRSGALFVVGRADDRDSPLAEITLSLGDAVLCAWPRAPRLRDRMSSRRWRPKPATTSASGPLARRRRRRTAALPAKSRCASPTAPRQP